MITKIKLTGVTVTTFDHGHEYCSLATDHKSLGVMAYGETALASACDAYVKFLSNKTS